MTAPRPFYLTAARTQDAGQDAPQDAPQAPEVDQLPAPEGDQHLAVTLSLQSDLTLDREARTITGTVLPYGVVAQRTSAGAVRFAAGSVRHHPDLKRVKLLVDHDSTHAVGYAVNLEQDENEIRATFHVPKGAAGDEALDKAENGVRDGLSLGADLTMFHLSADGRVTEVTEATLEEVSLVSLPAFTDSRVHTVRASMEPNPAPLPAAPGQAAPPAQGGFHAQAPAPYAPQRAQLDRRPAVTADQAARLVATVLAAGGTAASVQAALADVIPANDAGLGYTRPSFVDELWSADETSTPLTDALPNGKPLTSLKVQGWKWNVRPQVGPYTGNKAEIPTNPVSTVPAEATAERFAGGWDVDRAFVDLGDGSFIQSVFEAATADYKKKREAAIATKLAANATVVAASASLTLALGKLGTVAGQLGSALNIIALAPDVWSDFVNLGEADVPWWMKQQGSVDLGTNEGNAGGLRFFVNFGLAAGQVLALDRRAAKKHVPEGASPVKVQALDIANGGIDLGVYGYHAVQIHDARAVLLTTVTAV